MTKNIHATAKPARPVLEVLYIVHQNLEISRELLKRTATCVKFRPLRSQVQKALQTSGTLLARLAHSGFRG